MFTGVFFSHYSKCFLIVHLLQLSYISAPESQWKFLKNWHYLCHHSYAIFIRLHNALNTLILYKVSIAVGLTIWILEILILYAWMIEWEVWKTPRLYFALPNLFFTSFQFDRLRNDFLSFHTQNIIFLCLFLFTFYCLISAIGILYRLHQSILTFFKQKNNKFYSHIKWLIFDKTVHSF